MRKSLASAVSCDDGAVVRRPNGCGGATARLGRATRRLGWRLVALLRVSRRYRMRRRDK